MKWIVRLQYHYTPPPVGLYAFTFGENLWPCGEVRPDCNLYLHRATRIQQVLLLWFLAGFRVRRGFSEREEGMHIRLGINWKAWCGLNRERGGMIGVGKWMKRWSLGDRAGGGVGRVFRKRGSRFAWLRFSLLLLCCRSEIINCSWLPSDTYILLWLRGASKHPHGSSSSDVIISTSDTLFIVNHTDSFPQSAYRSHLLLASFGCPTAMRTSQSVHLKCIA